MNEIYRRYFDTDNLSSRTVTYNMIHTICIIGTIIACVLLYFFIPSRRLLYLCFGIAVSFFVTMVEANRTGHYIKPTIAMSVALNFFFFPLLYFSFGYSSAVISIFFIVGILYTVLMLDYKFAIPIGIFQLIFYTGIILWGYRVLPIPMNTEDIDSINMNYAGLLASVIFAGLLCGAAVRFRTIMFEKETSKAEHMRMDATDAYISKDIFLINMSHEIRTPMNAIVGNVDLLLDQEINDHVRESVYNILNSCNALLSTTNELMDLSKSENRDIVLYSTKYDIKEMFMDIINMMTVRLLESDLDFYVDINKDLPRYLYGDASKLRQVYINLLNNAIKYTKQGSITLRIDFERLDDNRVKLLSSVEDTGIGIRAEDIPKLFTQEIIDKSDDIDMKKSEGSGLGLSICKEIVSRMNGEISAKSTYHFGSTFSFSVVQNVDQWESLCIIPNPARFHALVFDTKKEYSDSLSSILSDLHVSSKVVYNSQDFEHMMKEDTFTHIFISYDNYIENELFIKEHVNRERLIIMALINEMVDVEMSHMVMNRPTYVINVYAAIMNETNSFVREVVQQGGFSCPRARILVVDDNYTNLNVASGLLRKYKANVFTALSGKECLRVLDESDVDMIFLDYMMPEMNGIDTLERIRKLPNDRYRTIPVVCLTANVVSGAKEMFLETGFDAYLPKPISVDRIEKTLQKYLPSELIEINGRS